MGSELESQAVAQVETAQVTTIDAPRAGIRLVD